MPFFVSYFYTVKIRLFLPYSSYFVSYFNTVKIKTNKVANTLDSPHQLLNFQTEKLKNVSCFLKWKPPVTKEQTWIQDYSARTQQKKKKKKTPKKDQSLGTYRDEFCPSSS